MCNPISITEDDVRALYPDAVRFVFVGASVAWVEKPDGTLHVVRREDDGGLTREPRPGWRSLDDVVRLHAEALQEEEEEECEYCGEAAAHEFCDECERCVEYCACPPFDPQAEWGTY